MFAIRNFDTVDMELSIVGTIYYSSNRDQVAEAFPDRICWKLLISFQFRWPWDQSANQSKRKTIKKQNLGKVHTRKKGGAKLSKCRLCLSGSYPCKRRRWNMKAFARLEMTGERAKEIGNLCGTLSINRVASARREYGTSSAKIDERKDCWTRGAIEKISGKNWSHSTVVLTLPPRTVQKPSKVRLKKTSSHYDNNGSISTLEPIVLVRRK